MVCPNLSPVRFRRYDCYCSPPLCRGRSLRSPYLFSSGNVNPLSPANPQQPTPSGRNTFFEHSLASSIISLSTPIWRVEHVRCRAMWRSIGWKSSRGTKNFIMNSAGSYKSILCITFFIRCRHGLWAHSTGYLPSSLAFHRAASSSALLRSAMSSIPLLSQICPQHIRSMPSGNITS